MNLFKSITAMFLLVCANYGIAETTERTPLTYVNLTSPWTGNGKLTAPILVNSSTPQTTMASFNTSSCKWCVRSCCMSGYGLNDTNHCEPLEIPVSIVDWERGLVFHKDNVSVARTKNAPPITVHPPPQCSPKMLLTPDKYGEDEYYLQMDGTLYMPYEENDGAYVPLDGFCVGLKSNASPVVLKCVEVTEDDLAMTFIGMLISVPFLFATFLVYAIIPELRNLHGKSLMCHVFSMMVAYVFLAVVQIASSSLSSAACVSFAFIVLFSFLVTFFWLNVMCFDIWWTFSGFRGFRGSVRDAEHKKFLVYSLYAWGVPTVLLIASLIMQFHPSIPEQWIRPRFGIGKCWFSDTTSTLLYFYGPMLILVVCNILLFIFTAFKIRRIKRETSVLKRQDSQRHNYENDKQRFNLYLKLFVVMGINWAMELISWWLQETKALEWFFRVTDVANTLQGILIFVIFVCKRQIWKLLVKRYHSLMGQPMKGHSSLTRTQTTSYSSSQGSTVISRSGNGMQMRTLSNADDKNLN